METAGGVPTRDQVVGCFLGGAVGDALGADVEFETLDGIRSRFGIEGISQYAHHSGGRITDDTQMTLFTAEGLLRAATRQREKGIVHVPTMVHHAYLRWLSTQSAADHHLAESTHGTIIDSGWLVTNDELHESRAPGMTCLAALRSGAAGTVAAPMNDSKGCGGVMRVAPIGLAPVDDPFDLACDAAALTHGHPSGYLSAGAFALVIAGLARGASLREGVHAALTRLASLPRSGETTKALQAAVALASAHPVPTPEAVETLGGGWVGEEALAIAVYAGLVATDFAHGVRTAVNHSGDSDSTGAIAGNLLGARWGAGVIPAPWRDALHEHRLVEQVAADFHARLYGDGVLDGSVDGDDRYPGW